MFGKIPVILALAIATSAYGSSDGIVYSHSHHPSGIRPSGFPGPFGGTGRPGALSTGPTAGPTGTGGIQTGDSTLTYTMGSGLSTTVVTTTIHHTILSTKYDVSVNETKEDCPAILQKWC